MAQVHNEVISESMSEEQQLQLALELSRKQLAQETQLRQVALFHVSRRLSIICLQDASSF